MSRLVTSISYEQSLEDNQAPDIIYLNADIINGTSSPETNGTYSTDPQIQFNETRDVPILYDSSLYNFSIVRFTMNGAGKDLPLFIPSINLGTANPTNDVNQTCYSCTIVGSLTFPQNGGGNLTIPVSSGQQWVNYESETQDTLIAPVPSVPQYPTGPVYNPAFTYIVNQVVQFGSYNYISTGIVPNVGQAPSGATTNNAYWTYSADPGIQTQDISTRYYWVYTYSWWLKLVNQTLATAMADIQVAFNTLYNSPIGVPITVNGILYPGGWGYVAAVPPTLVTKPPQIFYNPSTQLFTMYYDKTGFGENYITNTPISTSANEHYDAYFNANMFGLFTNFANRYDDQTLGRTNKLLVYDYLSQNVSVISGTTYILMVQDYASVSSLWSPVSSIVFTSTFLPIVNEQTTVPVLFGGNNLLATTTPSAFQPIITDISLAMENASDYRQFINYTPTGEYRITSFQKGRNEIRQVDVKIYWKNRLTGELIPLQMFNLSSVSIKLMFRKKHILGGMDKSAY